MTFDNKSNRNKICHITQFRKCENKGKVIISHFTYILIYLINSLDLYMSEMICKIITNESRSDKSIFFGNKFILYLMRSRLNMIRCLLVMSLEI